MWQSRRRKDRDAVFAPSAQQAREQLLNRLEECRKFRAEGEIDRFFHSAVLLHKEIASFEGDGDGKKDLTEMEEVAERVRFGGANPGSEVVEKHLRELERRIKNL